MIDSDLDVLNGSISLGKLLENAIPAPFRMKEKPIF